MYCSYKIQRIFDNSTDIHYVYTVQDTYLYANVSV